MKTTTIIAFILVIVGAIVWGLLGIFNFNLVSMIFGAGSKLETSSVTEAENSVKTKLLNTASSAVPR